MVSQAAPLPASAPLGAGRGVFAWLAERPAAAAAAALLAILLPVLFKHPAETGDPVEYYNAARCVADHVVCAAHDHWSARWPVFTSTGFLFAIFGESRLTMGLMPLVHAFAAVLLFTAILQRTFGREAALVGGLLSAALPLTSEQAMQLNADILELCFILAGVLALIVARERGGIGYWLLAGAMFALAVETRTTALVTAGAIGASLLLLRWPFKSLLLVAAGGAGVLGASCALQWLVAGDPLHSIRMALSHTKVPTTMLPPDTDLSGSPFFNLELIRNWHRNVAVHWTIDPALNIMASASAGALVTGAIAMLLAGRTAFAGAGVEARTLRGLAFCGAGIFLTICFVLSIHPTPRMFMPVIAALAFMLAVLVTGPRRDLKPLVLYGLVPVMMVHSFCSRVIIFDPVASERLASEWIAAAKEPVATDWTTHRHLNQSAAVRALPQGAAGAGHFLVLAEQACDVSVRRQPGWRVMKSWPLNRSSEPVMRLIDALSVVDLGRDTWNLCLYDI